MNQLTPEKARALRIAAGVRLIDIAIAAGCAPATVRSYEFGAPVRAPILGRLREAYERMCATSATTPSTPPAV